MHKSFSPTLNRSRRVGTLTALLILAGCFGEYRATEEQYKWAFAQNSDGTFHQNELCRESLAQSLYVKENEPKTVREASTNIFVVQGSVESYRVYAFRTQSECETALTNMVQRQAMQ